jgi:Holliday junction resolvasome RuvABC endonuclease subunit
MRLLAVDEGSHATGLAYFDGSDRPSWTGRLLPAGDWPWRKRMRYQSDQLRRVLMLNDLIWDTTLAPNGRPPDVIAMEGAVVSAKNPRMGVKVGECRGYFLAHFDSIFGLDIPVLEIPPAKARAAVGISAFAGRARSKDRYRQVAIYLGLDPKISEDEADAAAIGLAALAQLREERWAVMAR